MPTINDPDGRPAQVTDENRLKVDCVTKTQESHANQEEGGAYTWQFSDDPDAADDCIFYIKNNDDMDLVLEGIDLYITADCEVYLKVGGAGTTAAGTPVVGTNLNPGSGNIADVTCIHDGDVEAGGTFAGSIECNRYKYTAGADVDTHHINFPMDIIIPKNQVFSLWVDTIAVVITGTLYGYFHEKAE